MVVGGAEEEDPFAGKGSQRSRWRGRRGAGRYALDRSRDLYAHAAVGPEYA